MGERPNLSHLPSEDRVLRDYEGVTLSATKEMMI